MKRLTIYIFKCVTGVLIAFALAKLLHYNDYIWFLISIILVLSPDAKDALPQATNRIKANLIGAAAGLLMLLLHPPITIIVAGAVVITIVVCYFAKLENPTRSALAATIITTIRESGKHVWDTALERVIAVVAGCAIGLIITFTFHLRFIGGSPETETKPDE